jgi:type IV secretion system protein VirB9
MNQYKALSLLFLSLAAATVTSAEQQKPGPAKQQSKFDDPRVIRATERTAMPIYLCRNQGLEVTLPKHELLRIFSVGDPVNWQGSTVAEDRRDIGLRATEPLTSETIANITSDHDNHYVFHLLLDQGHCDSHVTLEADAELEQKIETVQPWVSPEKYNAALQAAEDAKKQLEEANKRANLAVQAADKAKDQFRSEYPERLVFDYTYDKKKALKFGVSSVFHDERFTYVMAKSEEPPVLFELKDGQPSLIEFSYADGVYRTARIIDQGYLVRGGNGNGKHQEKLELKREPKAPAAQTVAENHGGK